MAGESGFQNKEILATVVFSMVTLTLLFVYISFDKIKQGIAREIRNAGPKEPMEVYRVLLPGQANSCVQVMNLKDQVLPQIDCCIWMEVKLCSAELNRLIRLKNYKKSTFIQSDSISFLKQFDGRPGWWTPQILGDTLTRYTIRFNEDKEQTFFVGKDEHRMFLCDLAL